jgi:hypothetical protein
MAQQRPLFREGFHLKENIFVLPEEMMALDPQTKRDLTICNLFVNHQLSIANIQQLLDEDLERIVQVLIDNWILQDRRQTNGGAPAGVDRRKGAPLKVKKRYWN